ncbi:HAD-superfamily hydrolase, subfamily IA, variant 1 [Fibrisoma limi BUZ 3]|uniref:HAD-superfamily hydrolase, subfamily IA, variant 1 n=1 Tax=Fibrisoma limi BUZ 3 TaxID=1185876 RepID=I2GNX6_9BACT|nr:HAD hydrolase-like protein [Fibrisoma limi]CCH55604.1 HAD-superfamily hydrolase, subfamily IA, variant 1 [Fibrisoma limi BUZ 3]
MNYKLVIFDFDGTLANSFPFFLNNINVLAATYNFKRVEPDDVDTLRGLDARQMISLAGLPAWKIPFIARSFIRLMARDIDQITLFDGISGLLKQLSANGVQLAIVSSNSKDNVRQVLGPDNAALIRFYECGTALFGKQRKFRKVISKSGVAPSETLCVGDELRDIEAARLVNTAFGAVSWGFTKPDALQVQPDILFFQTVGDIASAVLGNQFADKPQRA